MDELRDDGLEREMARNGVSLVVAFGSRSTGRHVPASDLDLGVLLEDGRPLSARELGELGVVLQRRADVPVDVVDLATRDALFRYEVARDGVVLVGAGEPWKAFVAKALIDHADVQPYVEACIAGVARRARGA